MELPAYAEVFYNGERNTSAWFIAKNGAIGLTNQAGATIYFFA